MLTQKDVDYVNKEISEHQSKADMAVNQANETQRLLANQLILIAGIVITVSAAFLTTDHSGFSLGIYSRWALITTWIAFTISICGGIIGLIADAKFFRKWQLFFTKIAERLGEGTYTSQNINDTRNGLTKPNDQSPTWPLRVQIISLAFGAIAFMTLIIHLVLK